MVTGESKLWVGIKDLPTEVQLEMANTTNIITITQIPNNQYGYRVQLLDTDGSPLKDVVIKGIDDPNTEIRTNNEGIVQFYSSKSSFSGLTYEGIPKPLNVSMFPTSMQGYINDTSVITVNADIEGYYGYDITVTDNNGNILANHPVYTITNNNRTDFGTTDSTGHLITYDTRSSITIAAIKDGYYGKTNVSGTLKTFTSTTIKTDTKAYTGTLSVGNTITCMGKSWIVCDQSSNNYCLALDKIDSLSDFGGSNVYSESILARCARQYESDLSTAYLDIMSICAFNTTVNGVTAKVFVASYEQMNGGFSYFINYDRRKCKYNRDYSYYWASSPAQGTNNLWTISVAGTFDSSDFYASPRASIGFRPFIWLSL